MFLRNYWYCAAWSGEISEQPLGRTILNEKLVMFRDANGRATALGDICPHRFAPLHVGTVIDGTIQCRYHGLRFGRDGHCAFNPHGDRDMPRLRVPSYPLVERHGILWIWMGDPQAANEADIPSFAMHDDPQFVTTYDMMRVDCNYQMVCDNLLDLSHVEFLHPFLTIEAERQYEMLSEGDSVTHVMFIPDTKKSGAFQLFWPDGPERVTNRSALYWEAPGNMMLTVTATPADDPERHGVLLYNANIVTPETETTTHYFWALTRDFRRDEPEVSEMMASSVRDLFHNEDAWILNLAQQNMGEETDIVALEAAVLPTDRCAMRARMITKKLMREEARTGAAAALAAQ